MGRVVSAAAGLGQERALQVEAERPCPVRRRPREPGSDAVGEGVEHRQGRAHPAWQEARHAATGQATGHARQRIRPVHRIVAREPMDMDIDESRRDDRASQVRGASIRLDGDDDAVLDLQGPGNDPVGQHQEPLDVQ